MFIVLTVFERQRLCFIHWFLTFYLIIHFVYLFDSSGFDENERIGNRKYNQNASFRAIIERVSRLSGLYQTAWRNGAEFRIGKQQFVVTEQRIFAIFLLFTLTIDKFKLIRLDFSQKNKYVHKYSATNA